MRLIDAYIVLNFAIVLITSTFGAFSRRFDATILQRLALAMLAIWSAWRIQLLIELGWGQPHEWLIATAIGFYAIGTTIKTLTYRKTP